MVKETLSEEERKSRRKAASKIRVAKWQKDNPEKVRAKVAAWRAANPERWKAILAKYKAKNPSRIIMAKWRAENPDRAKELNRISCAKRRLIDPAKVNKVAMVSRAKRRAANPEWARTISRASHAKRRAEHPDKDRADAARYRAALKQCTVHYTVAELTCLRRETGHICACCGTSKSGTKSGRMTIDHIVPLSSVGVLISEAHANAISNIQFLCLSCNCRKRTIDWDEFLERSGILTNN